MKKYHLILIAFFLSVNMMAQEMSPVLKKVQEAKSLNSQEFDLIENILIPSKNTSVSSSKLKDIPSAMYFDYDKQIAEQLLENSKEVVALQIPYSYEGGSYLTLDLVKVPDSFYDYTVSTSGGNKYNENAKGLHYRGVVRNQESSSLVALSVFENEMMGIVSITGKGSVNIGKLAKQDKHIIYNDISLKSLDDAECIVLESSDNEMFDNLYSNIQRMSYDAVVSECVHIYFEVDYEIYQHFGNSKSNTENFVTGLFNQVAMLYMNEGITIEISDIFVWETPDSYSPDNTRQGLYDFEALRTTFNGDLAHLLSFRPENNSTTTSNAGGIAYVGALCGGSPYGHTRLFPDFEVFPNFSRQVKVVTHEIGHNLGSQHTQACVWNQNCTAIDGCVATEVRGSCNTGCSRPPMPSEGGTIMSYCDRENVGVDFTLGFGQQPGDVIRNFVANASCLSSCAACPANLNHTGTINSATYEASNSITSTATIGVNQTVTYDAGNFICLNDGFIADSDNDVVFLAHIDGCNDMDRTAQRNHASEKEPVNHEKKLSTDVIEEYVGVKNYPNPFTGQTTIEFTLEKDVPVTLSVADLTGKQIAILLDNEQKNKGTHQVIFNGNNYPVGMYYYTIQAGDYVATQKMTLVK